MKNRLVSDPADVTFDLFSRTATSAPAPQGAARTTDAELLALALEIVTHDPILADLLSRAGRPTTQN